MFRHASVAVALAIGLSTAAVLPAAPATAQEPVAPPSAPVSIEVLPTASGPRVAWGPAATGAPTSYVLWRRLSTESEYGQLSSGAALAHVDATLPRGESATYAVTAVNDGGSSDPLAAGPFTRAATDPVVATGDALVLDPVDPAVGGVVVTNPTVELTGDVLSAGTSSVTLPRTGTTGETPVADRPFSLSLNGAACTPATGTVDVTEVLYDAAGLPATYAMSFSVGCFGTTVHGVARHDSTAPFQAVTTSQPAGEWRVAASEGDRTITVTNRGGSNVTFGAATLGGGDASLFSVTSNGCAGQSLGLDQTCQVVVHVALPGPQNASAYLDLADDTARGTHRTALAAVGTWVPGAPVISFLERHVGAVSPLWAAPADAGKPAMTGYKVYRRVGDDAPTLVTETASTFLRETPAPAGANVRFGVAAVNAAGEGPTTWSVVVDVPGEEVLFARAKDGSDVYGVFASSGGELAARSVATAASDVYSPAASPDGRLVAYSSGPDLWVRNADGTGTPKNLTGAAMGGASREYGASFSNDGRLLAFTRETDASIDVYQIPVGGGTAVLRARNSANPAWLTDSRSLVVSDYTSDSAPLLRISPSNARTAIAGTSWGDDPAVSPDGRWLAFSRYNATADVYGVAVVPTAGAAQPVVVQDGAGVHDYSEPAWNADGTKVAISHYNWDTEHEVVKVLTWNGANLSGGIDWLRTVGGSMPAWRSTGLALTSAPYSTKSTATVGFALSGGFASATCKLDNAAAAPCAGTWTGTGLTSGNHTLTITASSPAAGSRVLAHTFLVDLSAPVVSTSLPNTAFTNGASAVFRYAASDASGVASYDARYRRAPWNATFGGYLSPAGWLNTRSGQLSLAITPGNEYCFSVRARDVLGNVSGWSAERCVGSPLDDRSLTTSTGWSRLSAGGYYRSTYTSTTRQGVTMARTGVQAKRLVLVATRCSTCGTVAVYMGSTLVANVNLAASTTQRGYHVALPVFGSVRSGTVTIKVTSSGKTVQIDGLGTRRT